jgi:ribonuclease HI
MKLIIHTDGGSRGNPGKAAVGVVIEGGHETIKLGKTIGIKTNNEAEYMAVIAALEEVVAQKIEAREISFVLDSLLVVNQLKGSYKVKQAHLQELLLQVRRLEQKIGAKMAYNHVLREENREADRLLNEALDNA